MNSTIAFDPLLPVWMIIGLTALIIIASGFAEYKGLKSSILRTIAAFVLCGALLNPQKLEEERMGLPDVALILTDKSESMSIGKRADSAQIAAQKLQAELDAFGNIETVQIDIPPGGEGTRAAQSLIDALGQLPAGRIAGVFALTDGQVHDLPPNPENLMPDGVPFHAVITGKTNARDRRLTTLTAPKFGMVGEQALFEVMIDDPGHEGERALLEIRLNGELAARFNALIGDSITLPLEIEKRGVNTVEIRTAIVPEAEGGELTPLNNVFVAEISGVRDRLRVLLITGEPHMGGRAWRNLLKSDPSVDLVQFTILTSPGEKNVKATRDELSLIPFPDRELFEEKLTEFDLVIFDQFTRRTMSGRGQSIPMLHPVYISNIARYVEGGGALLIASGPSFAGDASLARSPLIAVLPARPNGEIAEDAYRPQISEKGSRHPITSVFNGDISARWGRWYRTVGAEVIGGNVLMEDDKGNPLLLIDKIKDGRVALLLSDQAWLWSKNHDGGGPYNELFRRLGHWLMGEPDLEADRLSARIENGQLQAEYFSLDDTPEDFNILGPDGTAQTITPRRIAPGRFQASVPTKAVQGSFRVEAGALSAIAAAGALNPLEFKHVVPTANVLAPLAQASGGGTYEAGKTGNIPALRRIKPGAAASAENWAGLVANAQYTVTASRRTPLGPGWLYFLIILLALLAAWRFEGR